MAADENSPMRGGRRALFGYTHVSGVPRCPCADPGNYMMAEQPGDDPLEVVLRCWCGSTSRGRFDDLAERADFIAKHAPAATPEDTP